MLVLWLSWLQSERFLTKETTNLQLCLVKRTRGVKHSVLFLVEFWSWEDLNSLKSLMLEYSKIFSILFVTQEYSSFSNYIAQQLSKLYNNSISIRNYRQTDKTFGNKVYPTVIIAQEYNNVNILENFHLFPRNHSAFNPSISWQKCRYCENLSSNSIQYSLLYY